ncbi:hypothetical protein B0H10DRAFT_2331382 [Mycena sp. CBHHK59/15]|nr:hypothetical protein B0H10DRAFT_2331382 [Mycena sp. CBHHK59/15]
MGNSSSSSGRAHHDDSVDYGQLVPQGVYSGPRDWNQSIAAQSIVARRLAPFYRPLEDYDESWDDDQILAARKEPPTQTPLNSPSPRPPPEPSKPEAMVYRGAVECPICFLYYPPNINHSRCCDQAICTECFVQIKRSEPTATHLVSEPAACPYCVQDNFGVVYSPPPWRAGIGSEGSNSPWSDSPRGSQHSIDTSGPYPTHKRRQKSFGADSPEVVLTDHIRPDWEAKLAAVRAAVTRRANRRIICGNGRVHALSPEEAAQAEAPAEGSGSRRSRRRQQPPPGAAISSNSWVSLMVMEAMRLSLLDHEEQQRKEAEEKKKKEKAEAAAAATEESAAAGPGPGPSTLEARSSPPRAHSLVPSRNSLTSRSRSPSPNPLQALKDTASGWRRRTSSPPPFTTLSAALSTVSTASAVINGTGEPNLNQAATTPAAATPATTTPAATIPFAAPTQPAESEPIIPTITFGKSDVSAPAAEAESSQPEARAPPDTPAPGILCVNVFHELVRRRR